jgi:hypothetical protein
MAQADQTVQNATFPTVRADINNNLAALFTDSSGNTAPTVTVAFQDWIDTSGANPLWKKRNAANNAWITVATISASTIAFEGTLPSQSGQSGNYLTTNGTTASWGVVPSSSVEVFTSSGTFVKPANGTIAYVQLWGGGGGGGRNQGGNASAGGGGACIHRWFNLSDLASSISVTIGTGGVGTAVNGAGTTGGTSSFGALFSAFGGSGGGASGSGGGGGGGSLSAGAIQDGGSGHGPTYSGANGYDGTSSARKGDFGGGGGGGSVTPGGSSVWGGGGGRGVSSNTVGELGAVSLHGGNGGTGNNAGAGAAPGGGGGASRLSGVSSGAGGRGECRVYVW